MPGQPSINDAVAIEFIIPSPIENTWEAWTDPALILKWFGSDPNGEGVNAEMDVRPGGKFEISFRDSSGTEHTCSGVYVVVEKPAKLSFTWSWKSEPGVESLVTVSFTDKQNCTVMQFEHANLGSASKHDYLQGWQSTFVKLESLLGSKVERH
jgi:uncharacterized protein YndB with AHSA1/START domain